MSTFHIHTIPPIDTFSGLTPLSEWIANATVPDSEAQMSGYTTGHLRTDRIMWAADAMRALQDADTIWEGTLRHEPFVGAIPSPPDTTPYLVVKQENDGTTFVISERRLDLPEAFDPPVEVSTKGLRA